MEQFSKNSFIMQNVFRFWSEMYQTERFSVLCSGSSTNFNIVCIK